MSCNNNQPSPSIADDHDHQLIEKMTTTEEVLGRGDDRSDAVTTTIATTITNTTTDDLLSFDDDQSAETTTILSISNPSEEKKEIPKLTIEKVEDQKEESEKTLSNPTPSHFHSLPMQLSQLSLNSSHQQQLHRSSNSLVEIPLHESGSSDEEFADIDAGMGAEIDDADDEALDDAEGEHADHLSPLMMDNHTVIEHMECFQQQQKRSPLSSPSRSPVNDHRSSAIASVMIVDSAGNITIMKHSDTNNSLSSVDSDMCMSYDNRRATMTNASSSIDDSLFNSSSDNDPARDSGCETGPCAPSRPFCPVEADEGVVANLEDDDEDLHDPNRPFEVPDEEFATKIVEQVEFYFSNESILKDAFLLKHVRRNKEGFVSLKLVSSFKRVRQLTKDWRVVGAAIQLKSKLVELNDVQTKVRRLEALPNYDETMPSRTVVASDLAMEKVTIEKVYEMFSQFGEIALVRILRVGGPIPADVRQFVNKYPELLQKECALVEFIESRSARNALACEGVTVLEMVAPKKKTGKKAPITNVTRIVENNFANNNSGSPAMILYNGGGGGNGADQERSRGGAPVENNTPPRFQIRRTASGYYSKPDQVMYVPPPRKYGYNYGNSGYDHSTQSVNTVPHATGAAPATNSTAFANNQYQYQAPALNNHTHQSQQPIQHHHHQHQQVNGHHHQNQHHSHHHSPAHYPAVIHHHHQQQIPCPSSSPPDNYEVYRRTSNGHIIAVTSSPVGGKYPTDTRRYLPCGDHQLEMRRGSLPITEMAPRKMHSQPPIAVQSQQPPAIYNECQCSCQNHQNLQSGPQIQQIHSPAPRRMSMSNGNENLMYRRMSSSGSSSGERKTSVTETNWRSEVPSERKFSMSEQQVTVYPDSPLRKYSNGFDPLRKLSNADEYVNGRRISTDSGYDRKYSFSSDCSNARSRSNSFICNPVQIIRTPTGPDPIEGGRGFGQRTRKIGQILPPI